MPKKGTNDQGHIIEALKQKNYYYVWEQVKYVGYEDEPNMNRRFIIFSRAAKDFDTEKNNNFIYFYKKYLKYLSFSKNDTFFTTDNYRVIQRLKNEHISPSDKQVGLAKYLKDWEV